MENNKTFKMTYSAEAREEIQAICRKYSPVEEDKLARLRSMDAAVERKAATASIIVGVVGTILLGLGMSLIMSELGDTLGPLAFPIGVIVGAAGLAVLACAYPLYRKVLKRARKKAAPEILKLTEELMK